jgi:hypothetical protein
MEETSFETLEALGHHLILVIRRDFKPWSVQVLSEPHNWEVAVKMEKPTAIPFAEAPVVELRSGTTLGF